MITVTNVKNLLGFTDTTWDTQLTSILPAVLQKVAEITNITSKEIFNYSSNLTFSGNTITDSLANNTYGFINFLTGMDIRVQGSLLNDGLIAGVTVTSQGVLTVSPTLNTEAPLMLTDYTGNQTARFVTISQVKIPIAMNIPIADYCGWMLLRDKGTSQIHFGRYEYVASIKSESDMLKEFAHWRSVNFV